MLIAGAVSLHPNQARAQAATTQSAAAPATEPTSDIQKQFDQLADADPNVRDDARVALMGLKREQLADLRDIVEKNRPLTPRPNSLCCTTSSCRSISPPSRTTATMSQASSACSPTKHQLPVGVGD